jgi:hypothetical protein
MPTFPSLKSGASAQHPLGRTLARRTKVIEFLDGREQRFPLAGQTVRKWFIDLTALTDEEVETLLRFFLEMQGPAGKFTFVDPLSGTEYHNCRFEHESLEIHAIEAGHSSIMLVIREN